MKIRFEFENPLNRKQKICKTLEMDDSSKDWIKELMNKCGSGSMIILPVEIIAEYPDKKIETTTVMISTLAGKNNRVINQLVKPEKINKVIIDKEMKYEPSKIKQFLNRLRKRY